MRATRRILVPGMVALAAVLPAVPAEAAPFERLYSYSFDTAADPVPNQAVANADADLDLYGTWQPSDYGVRFDGDRSGNRSVGYAQPEETATITVSPDQAVGFGAAFRFEAPADGGCFADSKNLTQIGRFGEGLSQLKMQFSSCERSESAVYPECRVAGARSTAAQLPVSGSRALVDGGRYVVTCSKAPDPASGQTRLWIRTLSIDTEEITSDVFTVSRTGQIRSEKHLSVANKYPLPDPAENTDQFVGDIAEVSYCKANSTLALDICLALDLVPDPRQVAYWTGS